MAARFRVSARVLIVGAGPGGLTLGLLLARAGVAVEAYEQAATFEREFRGESLLPSGLQILEDLGLRERLASLERASPTAVRLHIGRSGMVYDSPPLRSDDGSPIVTSLPQRQLLEALAGEARALPGFSLRMGAAVRELLDDGCRIAGILSGADEVRADLVVGFDGRFSAVRRSAGLEMRDAHVDFDIAWCAVPRFADASDRYEATIRGREVCFWYPTGSVTRVGLLLRKSEFQALRAAGFDRFRTRLMAATLGPLQASLSAALRSWGDVTLLPAVSEMAPRWWRPGLIVLGDAAHPMSPVGAQGINVALQDAVVAARHLLPAMELTKSFDRREAIDAALAAIERERRPAVARIARAQNLLPRLMSLLGPESSVRLAIALFGPLARSGYRATLARALIGRFVWGDTAVRKSRA